MIHEQTVKDQLGITSFVNCLPTVVCFWIISFMLHLLGFVDVLVVLYSLLPAYQTFAHVLVVLYSLLPAYQTFVDVLVVLFIIVLACQGFAHVLAALFSMVLARLGFADLLPNLLLVEDLRWVGVRVGGVEGGRYP
jgi:hypothetical protein